MTIVRSRYGELMPVYASLAEELAAARAYLDHDYANLTALEIEFFRECERDPNNTRWEAAHAGQRPDDFSEFDFKGMLFINRPNTEPLDVGKAKVLEVLGPHPLTRLNALLALDKIMKNE